MRVFPHLFVPGDTVSHDRVNSSTTWVTCTYNVRLYYRLTAAASAANLERKFSLRLKSWSSSVSANRLNSSQRACAVQANIVKYELGEFLIVGLCIACAVKGPQVCQDRSAWCTCSACDIDHAECIKGKDVLMSQNSPDEADCAFTFTDEDFGRRYSTEPENPPASGKPSPLSPTNPSRPDLHGRGNAFMRALRRRLAARR